MKKLMNMLMLSCKKASGLIEKKIHFSLNPIEKLQLFLHASMCNACKSYKKKSKDLDSLLNKYIHQDNQKPDSFNEFLPDELKQRILKQLEENK